MKYLFLLSCVLSFTANADFNCQFSKHYASYIDGVKTEVFDVGKVTVLSFKDGVTDKRILGLDGKKKASDSKEWRLSNVNLLSSVYAGSSGDLLTIKSGEGDKYGSFPSVIQYTFANYGFTSVGECTGERRLTAK